MRRRWVLAAAFAVAASLVVAFASSASAFPGVSEPLPCNTASCHVVGTGAVNPVATLVSNDGVNATYTVSSGGLEWAIFNGATRIAGVPGATGTFAVAVGGTYTLFAVQGFPGPLGITTVTPASTAATFTLTYTAGSGGSIVGSSTQVVGSGSDGTTVTAMADSGFHFVSWSDGVPTPARIDRNVTANITVNATFAANTGGTFTLTYTAGSGGSIVGSSTQVVASGSDGTTVTARPNAGFHFVSWSDGLRTAARTDRDVTADATVRANFAFTLIRTALTINADHSRVTHGHTVMFTGTISPNQPNGTHINFYVKKPGSHTWVRVSTRHVFSRHHWSYGYRLALRGSYFFQVRFAATSKYAASTSRTIKVTSR